MFKYVMLIVIILLLGCNNSKKKELTTEEYIELSKMHIERLETEQETRRIKYEFERKISSIFLLSSELRHESVYSDKFKEIVKPLLEEAIPIYNLSPTDVKYIQSNLLYIGMPEFLIFLSWGKPTDLRRTTTQSGERVQYIYRDLGSTKYAYTENGILTAWQN